MGAAHEEPPRRQQQSRPRRRRALPATAAGALAPGGSHSVPPGSQPSVACVLGRFGPPGSGDPLPPRPAADRRPRPAAGRQRTPGSGGGVSAPENGRIGAVRRWPVPRGRLTGGVGTDIRPPRPIVGPSGSARAAARLRASTGDPCNSVVVSRSSASCQTARGARWGAGGASLTMAGKWEVPAATEGADCLGAGRAVARALHFWNPSPRCTFSGGLPGQILDAVASRECVRWRPSRSRRWEPPRLKTRPRRPRAPQQAPASSRAAAARLHGTTTKVLNGCRPPAACAIGARHVAAAAGGGAGGRCGGVKWRLNLEWL